MNLAVFDLDGTLTHHVGADEQCFVKAFADAYGIAHLDRHWQAYEHVTDSWIIKEVFWAKYQRIPNQVEIERYIECYLTLLTTNCRDLVRPIRGAQAFLANLSGETGWRCAIATGGWQRAAQFKMLSARLDTSGIPGGFAEDGFTREDIVRSAIDRASTSYDEKSFERIVLVGDAAWDVRTAKSLELPFVGVGIGPAADKLLAHGATHVIGDFLDPKHALRCLEEATVPS